MADYPLRSATDRCLGGPLPHQLANQTQAHPLPINLWRKSQEVLSHYEVLITVSSGYPSVWGRLPTRYSPVRRFPSLTSPERSVKRFLARLACVRHAASVHPEPGSNSLIKWYITCPPRSGLVIRISSRRLVTGAYDRPKTGQYLDSFQTRCA